jgi:hypothetical protein
MTTITPMIQKILFIFGSHSFAEWFPLDQHVVDDLVARRAGASGRTLQPPPFARH